MLSIIIDILAIIILTLCLGATIYLLVDLFIFDRKFKKDMKELDKLIEEKFKKDLDYIRTENNKVLSYKRRFKIEK